MATIDVGVSVGESGYAPGSTELLHADLFPAVQALNLEGVTWHTLRHIFASRLAMSGHGEGAIAALLRHSTTGLVRRYTHLSPTHLKAAVETVANFDKSYPIRSETHQEKAAEGPIPSGSATKTVPG